MKWLLDAQLPRRLAQVLAAAGHDAIHTLDLPRANRTTDSEIVALAARENRIVVTKDSDFVVSFHLRGVPTRLLLVSTGNISNERLCQLFVANLRALEQAFASHQFVELGAHALVLHV